MTITIWIIQCLLGLLFIITGSFKLFQSKEKVVASGGTWAAAFKPVTIKTIAGIELLSGMLLIVSRLIHQCAGLAPFGAASISLIMVGSLYVHIRRREFKHAIINFVFLLMALFIVSTASL